MAHPDPLLRRSRTSTSLVSQLEYISCNSPTPAMSMRENAAAKSNFHVDAVHSGNSGNGFGIREKNGSETSGVSQFKNRIRISSHFPYSNKRLLKLRLYLTYLRPWSWTVWIWPIVLGFVLAFTREGQWGFFRWIFCALTVISVHSTGTIVHTYFDYVRGFDKKINNDKTLVDRLLNPHEVVNLGTALYSLGCLGFFLLVFVSPASVKQSYFQLLALLFFGGLSGPFLYTGGSGLKYFACGDLLLFLIFGPITTLFSYASTAGSFSLTSCYYSLPLALNSAAILHCNNCRSIESDKAHGATTLAVLLGRTKSFVLFVFLLYSPYILLVLLAVMRSRYFLLPLLVSPATLLVRGKMESALCLASDQWIQSLTGLPQMTANISSLFGFLYVVSCFMEAFC